MGVEVEYGPIGSVRQFIQEKTMANDETIVLEQLNAKLRELADDELTRLIGNVLIIQDAKIAQLRQRVAELEGALRSEDYGK